MTFLFWRSAENIGLPKTPCNCSLLRDTHPVLFTAVTIPPPPAPDPKAKLLPRSSVPNNFFASLRCGEFTNLRSTKVRRIHQPSEGAFARLRYGEFTNLRAGKT